MIKKIVRIIFFLLMLNIFIHDSFGSQRANVEFSKENLLAFKQEVFALKEVLLRGRSKNEVSLNAQKLMLRIDKALKTTEHNFILMLVGDQIKGADPEVSPQKHDQKQRVKEKRVDMHGEV